MRQVSALIASFIGIISACTGNDDSSTTNGTATSTAPGGGTVSIGGTAAVSNAGSNNTGVGGTSQTGNNGTGGTSSNGGGSVAIGTTASGGAKSTGGTANGGAKSTGGTANTSGGTSSTGTQSNVGGTLNTGGTINVGACSSPTVRITEIDTGATTVVNEDEAALKPLMISPIPSGGSRIAWMGSDGKVHITELDANDAVTGSPLAIAAKDFGDIYADAKGGVLLLTRDAQGGGTLNCGNPSNLCGSPPSPAVPCYDMYMVRFDGTAETWATKLTSSSAALPPYSTSASGPEVYMIWWYAHHGRIASDGTNFAGFFGSAISVTQSGCINIHQGDRMKVVSPSGAIVTGGFDWGCSHSGYERILWDSRVNKYVTICKNDAATDGLSGKIAYAPNMSKILAVDLNYSNIGNIVTAGDGGYWTISSLTQSGQTAGTDGLADVSLIHFKSGTSDKQVPVAASTTLNERAPHLANYGASNLLAAWEQSTTKGDLAYGATGRSMYIQVLDGTTGAAVSAPLSVAVKGNRYQEFRSFPDGSVAYVAPGSSATKVKILRVMPCGS